MSEESLIVVGLAGCDSVTTVLLEAQIKMRNGFPQPRLSFYTLHAATSPDTSQSITAGQGIKSGGGGRQLKYKYFLSATVNSFTL